MILQKQKNIVRAILISLASFLLILPTAAVLADGGTVSPSISIYSPAANTSISGTVKITAGVVLGSNPIANVQFFLDGAQLGTPITMQDTIGVYAYSWDSTTATNGIHYISAQVNDTMGLTASSPSSAITILNTGVSSTAPTVAMIAPLGNVSLSGVITVSASVIPGAAAITKVQFTLDGNNFGSPVTTASVGSLYSLNWDTKTIADGNHVLSAIVTDANNVTTTSLNDPITIQNETSPLPSLPSNGVAHPNNTLINLSGTFYIIKNSMLVGVTNPGILQSLGYAFSDAVMATTGDAALPHATTNVEPSDGALVKTLDDPTVYVIADQQRHGFTSSIVFTGLGYKFSSVLIVTSPELELLPLSAAVSNTTNQHLRGTDVSSNGTVYWLDDTSRHPYASTADYNSWHIAGDFSTVVPANAADLTLPLAGSVVARVK